MAKLKIDFSAKLQKLEQEKENLINKRKEEIINLIDKIGCLTIDNDLIAGALIIAKELDNKSSKNLPENLKATEGLIREKAAKFFRKKQNLPNPEKEQQPNSN